MANFNEKIGMTGEFVLNVYDAADNLLESYRDANLVVSAGKQAALLLLGSYTANKNITKLSFGSNGADPVLTDVAITDEFETTLDGVSYPSVNSVRFDFSLELAENNGVTIREYGLKCADTTLFARKVRADIEKTVDIRLEGYWTITI